MLINNNMRLHESTKQLYLYAYVMYIKLLYMHFILTILLNIYTLYVIYLQVILYVSNGI